MFLTPNLLTNTSSPKGKLGHRRGKTRAPTEAAQHYGCCEGPCRQLMPNPKFQNLKIKSLTIVPLQPANAWRSFVTDAT